MLKKYFFVTSVLITFIAGAQTAGWTPISHNLFESIEHADFYNESVGIAIEVDKYHLTRDGGNTWKTVFRPDMLGGKCAIFVKDSDTLLIITSRAYSRVFYAHGFNAPLQTLDSSGSCGSFLIPADAGSVTSLGDGEVIYVAGCHQDTTSPLSFIYESRDFGYSWQKRRFPEMNDNMELLDIEPRNADTLVLSWSEIFESSWTGQPDFAEFRVDTFNTRMHMATRISSIRSVTCQSAKCIFNHYLLQRGNNLYHQSPIGSYGSFDVRASEFYDVDEFLTLPVKVSNNGVSKIYSYHISGDSIDETSVYEIRDYSAYRWRNISVTDYSVFIVANSRIYKRDRFTIGLNDLLYLQNQDIRLYQGANSVSIEGLDSQLNYSYSLFSMDGRKISSGSLIDGQNEVSFPSAMSKGIYILSLSHRGSAVNFKVLR